MKSNMNLTGYRWSKIFMARSKEVADPHLMDRQTFLTRAKYLIDLLSIGSSLNLSSQKEVTPTTNTWNQLLKQTENLNPQNHHPFNPSPLAWWEKEESRYLDFEKYARELIAKYLLKLHKKVSSKTSSRKLLEVLASVMKVKGYVTPPLSSAKFFMLTLCNLMRIGITARNGLCLSSITMGYNTSDYDSPSHNLSHLLEDLEKDLKLLVELHTPEDKKPCLSGSHTPLSR